MSEQEDKNILKITPTRIMIPVVLGLSYVGYLFYRDFDKIDVSSLVFGFNTWFWLLAAISIAVLRHFSYAYRLWIVADGAFTYKKCIELIFIWEFGSTASPSSVGGTAVSLFFLRKEGLSMGQSTFVIMMTILFDSIIFSTLIPLFVLILGTTALHADLANITSIADINGWISVFLVGFGIMLVYTFLIAYGVLINPKVIRKLIVGICSIGFLKRWKESAEKMGDDMMIASAEIKKKDASFFAKALGSTLFAWAARFLIVNCLILALVQPAPSEILDQIIIFARQLIMYVIMAGSPTPGASGIAEAAFDSFLADYIPVTVKAILNFLWRLLTYFSYLSIGIFVVSRWITKKYGKNKAA